MSNPLPKLYRDRVRSTPSSFDLTEVMADIHSRVERRTRRRRTGIAAGGSAAVVAALAVVTVALTTSGPDGGQDAAAAPSSAAPTHRVYSSPAETFSGSSPAARPVAIRTDGHLVAATTPKKAPLAVGRIPATFRYLGSSQTSTTYGSTKAKDQNPDSYLGKLALLVGTRYQHPAFKDKIAGLPARIRALTPSAGDPTRWMVDLDYNAKILLTVQIPNSAGLTRAQVRTMVQTLDIRDVSHPASG